MPYTKCVRLLDYGSIRRNPNFQNPDDGLQVIGTMSAEEIRQEKLSIWKNVSVISLSWMFLFTAYNAVANLQVRIFCRNLSLHF